MIGTRLAGAVRQTPILLAAALLACGGGPAPESPSTPTDASPTEEMSTETAGTPGTEPGDGVSDAATEQDPNAEPGTGGDFKRLDTGTAKDTHGVQASSLKPTATEALLKFVVVDKSKGPIEGVVVSLTGPTGTKYYTQPTDATGFADVLAPAGKKYEVVYLSLRGKDRAANLEVEDKKRLTLRLTLRYKGWVGVPVGGKPAAFVLSGVQFDTSRATIRSESFARLDGLVEYMTHKPDTRIQISGHTDNVGNKENNKQLSTKRAQACRAYLVSKGIDGGRISAVGYGDEHPQTTNDTAEGRQKNRRIEAKEL